MNTYGFCSINKFTFNLDPYKTYTYPKRQRDVIVTFFKIHNLIFDILGYIPRVSAVSGKCRIVSGLLMCVVTLTVGKKNSKDALIIGHWYDEALLTGISQMARGAIEAFVPNGRIVNASIGVIGTVYNQYRLNIQAIISVS